MAGTNASMSRLFSTTISAVPAIVHPCGNFVPYVVTSPWGNKMLLDNQILTR